MEIVVLCWVASYTRLRNPQFCLWCHQRLFKETTSIGVKVGCSYFLFCLERPSTLKHWKVGIHQIWSPVLRRLGHREGSEQPSGAAVMQTWTATQRDLTREPGPWKVFRALIVSVWWEGTDVRTARVWEPSWGESPELSFHSRCRKADGQPPDPAVVVVVISIHPFLRSHSQTEHFTEILDFQCWLSQLSSFLVESERAEGPDISVAFLRPCRSEEKLPLQYRYQNWSTTATLQNSSSWNCRPSPGSPHSAARTIYWQEAFCARVRFSVMTQV